VYPRLFQIGHFFLPTYGVLVASGLIIGLLVTVHLARQQGIDVDTTWNMGLVAILAGIVGSKMLYLFTEWQEHPGQPLNLFSLGYLSLEQRCIAENLYWAILRRIQRLAGELDYFPEELEGIEAMLSDTYFCNFSLFQSMPDSWAIKQLFPVMPIHRLQEQPSRPAVLGDITSTTRTGSRTESSSPRTEVQVTDKPG